MELKKILKTCLVKMGEQDFLDNVIIKYVEVLNDMELLEENLYLNIKYVMINT